MTLAGSVRARRYAREIARVGEWYETDPSDEQRARIQLDALNAQWERITGTVPHYSELRDTGTVPARFRSLEEFAERVPSTTRQDVRARLAAMTSSERPAEHFRITGGSTAQPVQLPAWHSELLYTRPDTWLGREWYGVRPSSRLFLLWGHSHLLGTGWRGQLRKWRTRGADALLGYRRFSAYDLRPEKLRLAADELMTWRPEYVIGYSVALDLFARHNMDRSAAFRALRLKVVIGTSERFPSMESATRIEELFGCPVGMEYGAVETGLVAHTHPATGRYRVFWRTYLVEAVRHAAGHRLLVTSLYPRCFPLVRYDLGDEVILEDEARAAAPGLTSFARMIGRCNDYVVLDDGSVVHSEVFTHAVRGSPGVDAYQVAQTGDRISLRYLSTLPLPVDQVEEIRRKLVVANHGLDRIVIERVAALDRTVAGKTPMVVRTTPDPVL